MTRPTDFPPIPLSDLRLEDALALLEHDAAFLLPSADESPTAYIQKILDGLCELSLRDPLTGLSNRRCFNNLLNREIDSVARSGKSVLLLMLDIDHFKKVNDTYGHHAGDLVLQAVAKCLETCVRPMDNIARFGGEEFAAILPNCPTSFGFIVAERIRHAVADLSVVVSPTETIKITISIGGTFAPEWVRSTTALWTERADAQLYRAKSAGRNCVFIEEPQSASVSADEKGMLFSHFTTEDTAALGDPDRAENDAQNELDQLK